MAIQRSQIAMTHPNSSSSSTSPAQPPSPPSDPPASRIWWPCDTDGSTTTSGWESEAKAQKVVKMRRDPHMAVMLEAGHIYETLRAQGS